MNAYHSHDHLLNRLGTGGQAAEEASGQEKYLLPAAQQ